MNPHSIRHARARVSTCVVVALLLTILMSGHSPSAGATGDEDPERHCLVHTVAGEEPNGRLHVSGQRCFADFPSVLAEINAPAHIRRRVSSPRQLTADDMAELSPRDGATEKSNEVESTASAVIGIHYDGVSATGDSFSVTGSSCSGGYLNMAASWNNRIGSTVNGCPTIRHFDAYNKLGTSQSTTGYGGNLSYMDNRTSSIQYS